MIENEQNELAEISINMADIRNLIYFIRGRKVMIDRDLAMLYGVPTKVLNQAVKRNIDRFPSDFMFKLSKDEMNIWISQTVISKSVEVVNWKSQIVTSNSNLKQSLRKQPLAFTEQGIAMLSSILNSKKAIQINIQIIRTFTKLRDMVDFYKELREKVEAMEQNNETNFREIFRMIRQLTKEDRDPKKKIGFSLD